LISEGEKELRETWFQYGMDCIEPGLTYFADTIIDGPLKSAHAIFKAARLLTPGRFQKCQSRITDPIVFRRTKSPELPHWAAAAKNSISAAFISCIRKGFHPVVI